MSPNISSRIIMKIQNRNLKLKMKTLTQLVKVKIKILKYIHFV